MAKTKQPKIGLALGSGGPKGLSHIGIIKVLEKNNVPIDYTAGSSIGLVAGGFYAYTKDIKKIEEVANSSIKLLRYHLASANVKDADIIINPKIGKVGWNKFIDSKNVVLAGEKAMQLSILQLKELIRHRSNSD